MWYVQDTFTTWWFSDFTTALEMHKIAECAGEPAILGWRSND